ncbi:MAG: squalene/phytoene synthase family protein [Hyphomicrobiales bacterium]|nr:squalene/phytoene synthase family protein [Hyphomicrobiales bacterium]MBV9429905.1 squalene/phytoene synthase family protein [Bradyrhizobiaceae bacterium]
MADTFAYCENLVRAGDKDRWLASLFAPADRRAYFHALYAFNLEIARVRELAREPMAGEIRLQWWREVIAGVRPAEAAANPVASALLETIARYGLPAQTLLDLIEARAFDLYNDPMPTLDAFAGYGRRTASALIALAAQVLGGNQDISEVSGPAGIAYATTGLLRAVALHASRGQVYVPADVLARHGADVSDILAGRTTHALRAALSELRGFAAEHFDMFATRRRALPPASAPAFLPVALVPVYLKRMERPDYDPFRTPVDVPQWRRQWILWRAARKM